MKAEMVVFAGDCSAETLVLDEPLSFWGGLDPKTGLIIDEQHPQKGQSVAGRVLLMPGTRGSTSAVDKHDFDRVGRVHYVRGCHDLAVLGDDHA